jgi:hypothetical protein
MTFKITSAHLIALMMATMRDSEPLSIYAAAFGSNSSDRARGVAFGLMMQNPTGFVDCLAELIGPQAALPLLSTMADDASAPAPLRTAAREKFMDVGAGRLRPAGVDWGEAKAQPLKQPPMKPPEAGQQAPAPVMGTRIMDPDMKSKYAEAVRPVPKAPFGKPSGKMVVLPLPVLTVNGNRFETSLILLALRK